MTLIRKHIYKITIFVLIIFLVSILLIKNSLKENELYVSTNDNLLINKNNTIIEENNKEEEKELANEIINYVDIKGAIATPGVYQISTNTRVIDVINMAGGLLKNADTSNINLAKKVKDEMVIIIYQIDEIKEIKNELTKEIIKENIIIDTSFNDAIIKEEDLIYDTNKKDNNDNSNMETNKDNISEEKISINTASLNELMTLSGIGESKAKAIIKYRQEIGPFNSIEDLLNVSGIGNSIYEKIKDNITT